MLRRVYDLSTRDLVLSLIGQGLSQSAVSRRTGVSRATIRDWQRRDRPMTDRARCPRCAAPPRLPEEPAAYAYLLGLYLGDGCISRAPRTFTLRIACAEAWPGLVEECTRAVRAVRPDNAVRLVRKEGCVMVTSSSNHWPCLFPQHGPGRKHERPIVLAPWQREIVDEHGWAFVRGLVHSDGCRVVNWTTRLVGGQRKRYEYPRYFFTNTSADIIDLCTAALDALGVSWTHLRQSRAAQTVSVARRDSVALMDRHVGPKF
ncbi:transcriptional regulator [Streptomyces marincola]|uniref:transcriptional regulator n=1 Tax=Streptomyces marincola TaxID=2878388 RepID=UPI001CF59FBE|nr:transcriptional regulator [Streptomyces marincola]UCM87303.1 transcriptional regulator [Streptomyces marincola]